MLAQTPSQIFKADFAFWKKEHQSVVNRIINYENNTGHLKAVTEIILDENGIFIFEAQESSILLVLTLYGKIQIDCFNKVISPKAAVTLQSREKSVFEIRNYLSDEKADVLIIELQLQQHASVMCIEELRVEKRNSLVKISQEMEYPNFIGLYTARKEETYSLYYPERAIFAMAINGAFEFQNRLLETRDSILLQDIETLEFESLSENALIILFEI